MGEICVSAGSAHVCELQIESSCNVNQPCPTGLVCASDNLCRDPCSAAQPCTGSGQQCISGACFDQGPTDGGPDTGPSSDSASDAPSDTNPNAVTYSQMFSGGQVADAQCAAWDNFRLALSGTYTSITLSGSNDPVGITCTGVVANELCNGLHTGAAQSMLACGSHGWTVKNCGGDDWAITPTEGDPCTCISSANAYVLAPCTGSQYWGAIDAMTCSSLTQTMTLTCQ